MNTLSPTKKTRRGIAQRGTHRYAQENSRGAATSAAKMNGRSGVRERNQLWTYISGEGWVYWPEIERSVAQAFAAWQVRQQRKQMRLVPL